MWICVFALFLSVCIAQTDTPETVYAVFHINSCAKINRININVLF
jgi:hypothetical protein